MKSLLKDAWTVAIETLSWIELQKLSERLALARTVKQLGISNPNAVRYAYGLVCETLRRKNLIDQFVNSVLKPKTISEFTMGVQAFLRLYVYQTRIAKNWAEFDVLPEQNHNGVAGIAFPEKALERLFVFFLQSSYDHPRVALRHKLTYQLFMQEGIGVDTFTARGKSRLAQMMNATQFGDYLSYYLAMLNGADPTPIPPIIALKEGLAKVK